jgi:ribosomal protein S18 acetylase RimI-like enzyme
MDSSARAVYGECALSMTRIALRFLTPEDIPFADSLRAIAGWNQTPDDWRRFIELSPKGCLAAEVEGRPVATATTIQYGREVAWIGMILVHPDFRRRGIARILLEHCIELLRAAKIKSIKLDATPEGRAVYLQLGFKDEFSITRYAREAQPNAASSLFNAPDAIEKIVDLDAQGFGARRENLLPRLAKAGQLRSTETAFAILRPGARADYLGPIVAPSVNEAVTLAASLTCSTPRPIFCDIPDQQTALAAWAAANGFAPARKLTRMYLGENIAASQNYFAIAAPDLG